MKISKNPTTKAIIPEIRGTLGAIRYPAFSEVKFDGEACLIMYDETWADKIITTNKYGTMRSDWSKLDEIADILESKDVRKAVFLAELYYGAGHTGDLYKLLSHKDDDDLNIKIYDVIHLVNHYEMKAHETKLIDRKEMLGDVFGESKFLIHPVLVNSKDEVNRHYQIVTGIGYEGTVIKMFDGTLSGNGGPCAWVKMKKKDQNDYPVHLVDPTLERIEILVPFPTPGNPLQTTIVGCKCPNKYKKNVQLGDMVTIEHQGVLDSGSLRHPVFIGLAEKEEKNDNINQQS